MPYIPRFECAKIASFQTTRARHSELWFVGNQKLEQAVLGYAARYVERYQVKLYALSVEGNHIHNVAHFEKANRAQFMRDFNSSVARAVPRYQTAHPGGQFWGERYSSEYLPGDSDIEDKFFYTVLQPVNDGLVDDIRDYPWYNCFEDAITAREVPYKVIRWKQYNDARRFNPKVPIENYTEIVMLKYTRLPGYENLSQAEYEAKMREELIKRTAEAIAKRKGKRALGVEKLLRIRAGSRPRQSKQRVRGESRPRVLSKDPILCAKGYRWHTDKCSDFRASSRQFRKGDLLVEFPKGSYRPTSFTQPEAGTIT